MNDGVNKLRGGRLPSSSGAVDASGAPSVVAPPPLVTSSSGELRYDAALLNPPNARLELAWETRTALSKLVLSSSSASDRLLAQVVDKGGVANDALLALIDRLFPNALVVSPRDAAVAIRALPIEELRTALREPLEASSKRLDALLIAQPKEAKSAAVLDRGAAILNKLASSANEKERAFLSSIRGSSASLGLLAEALDAKTVQSFLSKVRSASASRLAEMADFVATDMSYRRTMQDLSSSPPALSDSVGRASTVLMQQLGFDETKARGIVLANLEAGRAALAPKLEALRASFGAAVADAVFSAIDPVALLAPGTHVTDGGMSVARDLPFSSVERVPWIEQRLLEEAVRVLGDQLGAAIAADPSLKKISALLDMQESPRSKRMLLSTMVEHYGAARDASETRSQFLSRLGGASVLSALKADFSADSAAFVRDFGELKESLVEVESTEREAEKRTAQMRRELDSGVLRLPAAVKKELEAAMIAAYPHEGIGYVLSDGGAYHFYSIKNDAADAGHHGVQNADDLSRMNAHLQASGWFVLGLVHSHPQMRALFSPDDLDRMKSSVALSEGRRTIIAGIEDAGGKLSANLASFASGHDGQVLGEDRIHVAR